MQEKIKTLHPHGKNGVNMSRAKYDQLKTAVEKALQKGPLTFSQLLDKVQSDLSGHFEGSISWYCEYVKLDLEARGLVKRVENQKPQLLELSTSLP